VKEYPEKGRRRRRRILSCYFKNDVHESEGSKTVNALLSRLFFHNYSNSPEKSGCLPSFFLSLVCVKENENRLCCKDYRQDSPFPLFFTSLGDSLLSHGNILNSLESSFLRLN